MSKLAVWCLTGLFVAILGSLTEASSSGCGNGCEDKFICLSGRPKCRVGKRNCNRYFPDKCVRDPCKNARCDKETTKCILSPQTDFTKCSKRYCIPIAECVPRAFPCTEIKNRGHIDSWSSAMYIPKPLEEFDIRTPITGWNFYAYRTGTIELMLFRPLNAENKDFEIVGKTVYNVLSAGEKTIRLDKEDWIKARPGDLIGFNFPGNSIIPFDREYGCDAEEWTVYVREPESEQASQGAENEFTRKQAGWYPCRRYAIRALTKKSPECRA